MEMWLIDNLNHYVSVKTEQWSCSVIGCMTANLGTNCTEKQHKSRVSLLV